MHRPRCSALACQLATLLGGLLLFAVPPAKGAMLLVPTDAAARRAMLPAAVDAGARLVGPGPFAGSYVVFGGRSALVGPLVRLGVLPLAAPPAGCGR